MIFEAYLPKGSNFYLYSITLTIASMIITLIVTIKLYVWYSEEQYEESNTSYFLVENHPFIMTAIIILNGFSLLVPRLCSSLQIKPIFSMIIHGSINGMVVVLSFTPIYVLITGILTQHISRHFYSIHCWFGLISILLLIFQFSFAIVYYPLTYNTRPEIRIFNKFHNFHKNTGYSVFGLICLSSLLGISEINSIYMEKFPEKYHLDILLPNLLALSITSFGLIILYIVFTRLRLEVEMVTIRIKRLNEKQRFVTRVIEKQQKKLKVSEKESEK